MLTLISIESICYRTFFDVAGFSHDVREDIWSTIGEFMPNPRYIVVKQESGWRVVQGGRRFPANYPNMTQALRSAIALAQWAAGRRPAVLIRDEDGRFFTVWVIGRDQRPNKRARPWILSRHKPS